MHALMIKRNFSVVIEASSAWKLLLFIHIGKVITVESLHKHAIMMYCCNVHTKNNNMFPEIAYYIYMHTTCIIVQLHVLLQYRTCIYS